MTLVQLLIETSYIDHIYEKNNTKRMFSIGDFSFDDYAVAFKLIIHSSFCWIILLRTLV